MRPAAPLPAPKPGPGTCCLPCCTERRTPRQVRRPHTCSEARRVGGSWTSTTGRGAAVTERLPSRQGVCRRLALSRCRPPPAPCAAQLASTHTTPRCAVCPLPLTPAPPCRPFVAPGHPRPCAPPVLTPRPFLCDLSCTPGPGSGVVTYCSQFAARTAPPFAVRFASQVCWQGQAGRQGAAVTRPLTPPTPCSVAAPPPLAGLCGRGGVCDACRHTTNGARPQRALTWWAHFLTPSSRSCRTR